MSTTQRSRAASAELVPQDYGDDSYDEDSTPKAGTKRLFSNRDSKLIVEDEQYNAGQDEELDAAHSGKRYRSSEWPLPNTVTASATPSTSPRSRKTQHGRNARHSPSRRLPRSRQRSSKFVEGSMNDRASAKPPTTYLGDEELRERYEQEETDRGRKLTRPRHLLPGQDSAADSSADRSEVSRHSSIVRFGKSIAASFNPSNWFGKSKHHADDNETPHQKELRERKEKAERIYAELKQSGHFRDADMQPTFRIHEEHVVATPKKHDSGVSLFSHARISGEIVRDDNKRMGRIFLETPRLDNQSRAASQDRDRSVSVGGSGRRSIFSFKKRDAGSVPPEDEEEHRFRRIPSRKDLQHQQKLVKRVSDLEGKLEAARKKLSDALGQPFPGDLPLEPYLSQLPAPPRIGRPRFVPGALASLPSERLLAGYVPPEEGEEEEDDDGFKKREVSHHIGQAVTSSNLMVPEVPETVDESYEDEEGTPTRLPAKAPSMLKTDKSLPEIPVIPDTPPFEERAHIQDSSSPSRQLMESIEDRVMNSIEIEVTEQEFIYTELKNTAPRHQTVKGLKTASAVPSSHYVGTATSSHLDDSEDSQDSFDNLAEMREDQDSSPIYSKVGPTSKPKAATKKRKSRSSFERIADDGGNYDPGLLSESESEYNSMPKRTMKKTYAQSPAPHPHKLQKTTAGRPIPNISPQEELNPTKDSSLHQKSLSQKEPVSPVTPKNKPRRKTTKNPSPRFTIPPKKAFPSSPSTKPTQAPASKLGQARKSTTTITESITTASSPSHVNPKTNHRNKEMTSSTTSKSPHSDIAGASTRELSAAASDLHPSIGEDENEDEDEDEVPPLPTMPRSVRLPSGEVVNSASHSYSYSQSHIHAHTHTQPQPQTNFHTRKLSDIEGEFETEEGGNEKKRLKGKLGTVQEIRNEDGKGKENTLEVKDKDSFVWDRDTF